MTDQPTPDFTAPDELARRRVRACRELLAKGRAHVDILQACVEHFEISSQQALADLSAAVRQLCAEFRHPDPQVAVACERYRVILENENLRLADRIRAQQQIDRLLASASGGAAVEDDAESIHRQALESLTDDERRVLARFGERCAKLRRDRDRRLQQRCLPV